MSEPNAVKPCRRPERLQTRAGVGGVDAAAGEEWPGRRRLHDRY